MPGLGYAVVPEGVTPGPGAMLCAGAWWAWLLHEVPVLRVDGLRGRLRQGALEVVRDLGELEGGVRLPLLRQLRRQVILPVVHVGQVPAGERLLDQCVVLRVAVAAGVGRRAGQEIYVARRQV